MHSDVQRILLGGLILAALGGLGGSAALATEGQRAEPPRPPQPSPAPTCNVAGPWAGRGIDRAGTDWTYTIELTQSGRNLQGAFAWTASNGTGGTELVRGSVDCASRAFRLDGYRLEGNHGLITGDYQGHFGADWRTLSGFWTLGIPGTFNGSHR